MPQLRTCWAVGGQANFSRVSMCCRRRWHNEAARFSAAPLFSTQTVHTFNCKAIRQHTRRLSWSEFQSKPPITADQYSVLEEEYELGHELGAGRFGTVYLATDRKTAKRFAVKSIEKHAVQVNGMSSDMLRNEVEVLQKLTARGPHERTGRGLLTELTAVHEDETYVWLVSPLYEGGELFDRIVSLSANGRPYTEVQAALIFEQLLAALHICHQNGIAHRDVKPENILLKESPTCASDPISQLKIVLVDFGVAKSFSPGQDMSATEMAGSLPYMAPELIDGRVYSQASDLWSAGVVLYILLSGKMPFYGNSPAQTKQRIRDCEYSLTKPVWDDVSDSAKDLVRKLIEPNTTQRLTAAEALEHPWVVYRGLPTDGQAAADLATVPQTMAEYQHATRAQRAVAQLMATNLLALHAKGDPAVSAMTAAWLDHLSGIFALYDRDSDGRIRRDEIEAGLVVLRKWKSTVGIGSASVFELAPEVAAHVDIDDRFLYIICITASSNFSLPKLLATKLISLYPLRSGSVEVEEFVSAAMHRRLATSATALQGAFAAIDTNKSGLLEFDELLTILSTMSPNTPARELVSEVESIVGPNRQGLSREQFEELMRLPEDTFQSHRSQATCIRLDRSLSGLDFEASH